MDLVFIRSGSFTMGSEANDVSNSEKPVHQVSIIKPFYMGKYEVTQEQWQALMGSNPSAYKNKGAKNPVDGVSWDDCQQFVAKLNEKLPGLKASLPTEAQWEYACRAGSTTRFCYGDDGSGLREYAWYMANSDNTSHPVGAKKPNAWGLYDMHGNVLEWCSDWYADYLPNAQEDPQGPASGGDRVVRGGSFYQLNWDSNQYPRYLTSSLRGTTNPGSSGEHLGLRVVVAIRSAL
jgi:formylglycine-generating enzyme required for sulfatase activity